MAERSGTEGYFDRGAGLVALWFGFLAGPAAWFLHLMVSYSLVVYVCRTGAVWLLHLATAGTILLAGAGVLVAMGSWRRLFPRSEPDAGPRGETRMLDEGDALRRSDPADPTTGRARLMALGGIALSGFFLAMILMAWIPDLVLSPCDGRLG